MTKLRPEDLPPELRQQLAEKAGTAGRRKKSRSGVADGAPCPGHCQCGEAFPNALRWQRHSDQNGTGHRRWSIDLPDPREETP